MKTALPATILIALCASIGAASAQGSSILNQSNDDLLKGFDAGKTLTAPSLSGPGTNNAPAPTWAPQSSAPGSNSSTYQPPPQLMGQPVQKGLLQRVIEGAMNAVNVSSNETDGTHVKLPFVNVDVGPAHSGVNVKAPFIKYNTQEGASVKAPFVNIHHGGKSKAGSPSGPTSPIKSLPADPNQSSTK